MSTVYLKEDLIDAAKNIIEAKKTADKIKASADLSMILWVKQCYDRHHVYDVKFAIELDNRLRREYPDIAQLQNIKPSENRNNFSGYGSFYEPPSASDPLINNLANDYFGIIFSVLKKEKIIETIEEFVDRNLT